VTRQARMRLGRETAREFRSVSVGRWRTTGGRRTAAPRPCRPHRLPANAMKARAARFRPALPWPSSRVKMVASRVLTRDDDNCSRRMTWIEPPQMRCSYLSYSASGSPAPTKVFRRAYFFQRPPRFLRRRAFPRRQRCGDEADLVARSLVDANLPARFARPEFASCNT